MMNIGRPALLMAGALLLASSLAAQTLEPIRYRVSFPAPDTHYLEVEASFPTEGQPALDLMMPVWTPGSYLVREYARNVEGVTAADGNQRPLSVEKTRKNRWRVTTNGAGVVWLRYRVYAHEMSVRTNWVDDRFALVNGAPTFITTLLAYNDRSYEVQLLLPPGWSRSLSGMPDGAGPNTYRSPDYDTLVDSPIVAGNPAVYEFSAGGKPYYLVTVGDTAEWDAARAVQDLSRIVRTTSEFWGIVPYERYLFLNIVGGPNNGLEHKNSTVINTPRDSTLTRSAYLGWLSTAGHEYFHTWNVKRLRPIELGPFDYENEVYTRSLWFVEGVTDYYADLQNRRAGVSTTDEYLSALSAMVASLQTTPGRLVQPAELASYDAWIKYYRPDENSVNASISYYVKGCVIGFLLDAKIRRATNGAKSLDDLMRLLYQRFSAEKGFTPQDLRAAATGMAGPSLLRWLDDVLETTAELDYQEALDWYGLRFHPSAEPPKAWLGVGVRLDSQRTIVSEIVRGSPAATAGIHLGDEIAAVNDVQLTPGQLTAHLVKVGPGNLATIAISRRGATLRLDVRLGTDPAQAWSLGVRPDATESQISHLGAWLQ